MANFKKQFENPANEFRSMPFWVWNGDMSKNKITETLEQYKRVGIGGAFVHPRPGLITEYLSEKWFDLWQHAINESKRLGLECHIYDENSYPSGFAGGHVISKIPYAAAKYMVPRKFECSTPPEKNEEILKIIELDKNSFLVIEQNVSPSNPWTAWFPSVDRTLPQVTEEFIASTHEKYSQHFSNEFGKTVKYAFTDEPAITNSGGLPFSPFICKEFKRDHGYDLMDNLDSVFVNKNNSYQVRFDYYFSLQKLWINNFCKPLFNWCEKNNLKFTGHFMEHEWPNPASSPSVMASYEWMQSPGIDMLAFLVDFNSETANKLHLMNIKEVASVARQLGKERVLCEVHGGGGYNAGPEDFKRMCDWIQINGVNLVCEHLSYQTICGARKYDWAQTFSDHSPWFKFYKKQGDHQARLSCALVNGKVENRVLLLQPTTTAWLHYMPKVYDVFETPTHMKMCEFLNDECQKIKDSQADAVQFLSDNQVDFDLGDEFIIENHASVENGKFAVGKCCYDVVVIPETMENILDSTLTILENYLECGGKIISVSNPLKFVNGRINDEVKNLAEKYKDNWTVVDNRQNLLTAIDKICRLKIKCVDGAPLPKNVSYENLIFDDGNIHFFINSGFDYVNFKVNLPKSGVEKLDTSNGNFCRYQSTKIARPENARDDCQIVEINIPPAGHLLLRETDENYSFSEPEEKFTEIKIDCFDSIERTAKNILPIHYCNLTVGKENFGEMPAAVANAKCWTEHGFKDDIWSNSIQFKNNYSGFKFDENSGFVAEYLFSIDDSTNENVLSSLELAIERQENYEVFINGKSISFDNSEKWFDENIKKIPVGNYAEIGTNSILLKAKPFNIHCEIAPVYLLGDFAVFPVEKGFVIKNPQPLKTGDWTKQGLPFYNESVKYIAEIELNENTELLNISIGDWNGSVVTLEIDGEDYGASLWPPYSFKLKKHFKKGKHTVSVEIIGNLGNLMGPHFSDRYPIVWSWLDAPTIEPRGAEYKISPYGLEEGINLFF